jgi:hypothetical protein
MGERGAVMFSTCGMPWRSNVRRNMPKSQRGRVSPSHTKRGVGRNGLRKPLRTPISRFAATETSAVTTSVS